MIPEAIVIPLTQEIKKKALKEARVVGERYRTGPYKPHYRVPKDPSRMARGFMAEIALGRFLHLERHDPSAPTGSKMSPDLFGSHVGWKDIEVRAVEHPSNSHQWKYVSLSTYPNDYRKKTRAFVLCTVWEGDETDPGWVKAWGWQTGQALFFKGGPVTATTKGGREYKLSGELYPDELQDMEDLVAKVAPDVWKERWG